MNNSLQVKQITISSIEVAEMLGISHSNLLKKLDGTKKPDGTIKQVGIIPILNQVNFHSVDYFIPDTYKDAKGEERPCYQFTKLGCDFIANKFTGEKGILFTAKYVKRFNEMAEYIKTQNQSQSLIEYDNKIQHVEQRIEKLEDTMTIDYGQQNDLRMLGNSVVVNALGGYETNAYKAMGKKVFARLWKDYKIYFRVNSYKNTPRKRYFEAQDYIVNWHPDANTSIMIKKLNVQKEVGALA